MEHQGTNREVGKHQFPMEGFGGSGFDNVGTTVRKRRSSTHRRPRTDSQPFLDNVSNATCDQSTGCDTGPWKREFNLNQCALSFSSISRAEAESSLVKERFELHPGKQENNKGSGGNGENRSSEYSGVTSSSLGNENKLRKVKLKVGGVTRTIHAKATSDGGTVSIKLSHSAGAPRPRPKLVLQDTTEDELSPSDMASGVRRVSPKNYYSGDFNLQKEDCSRVKISEGSLSGKLTGNFEPVRKSKRVPKPRILDGAFDEGDEDGEARYLERLKASKIASEYAEDIEDNVREASRKERRISMVLKSRGADGDYDEDVKEELASDGDAKPKYKKQKMDYVDSLMEDKKEVSLTKRQQALQSSKDVSAGSCACLVEFPNGLPPAPPRKQKDKLSEVEQQLKKTEAIQRRKMQSEKADRESMAEAVRKVLGQDSSRKKREDKEKKRRDELTQERAANASTLPSNTVRWVIGPTGTVVIFPKDMDLSNIFNPRPCSYPPPRERCAGPSCTKAYKYRHSKSKLPLCSLHCYKAIQAQAAPLSTC